MNDCCYRPPNACLFSLLLTLFFAGCERSDSAPVSKTDETLPVLNVQTLEVAEENWPRIIRSQGSLYPDEEATLGIKVEGRVFKVHVDLGDVVQPGDPLVTVYQDDFKLRVKQAEAQLSQARSAVGLKPGDLVENLVPEKSPPAKEQQAEWDEAKANLERARVLFNKKVMGQAEYDQIVSLERVAAARYDSALNGVREKMANITVQQSHLDLAQEDLNNTVLTASYTAVVQKRLVAPGSYIKMGDPLLVLVRIDQLRYRGSVPERLSTQLKVGQPVELKIESLPLKQSKVTRISPFLDQMSRALLFESVVDNSQRALRAGLFAEGQIIVDPDQKAIVVPMSAVVQFAGTEKVWKVEGGKVKMQEVLLGEQRGEYIRILEGLQPGDRILLNAREGRPGILADSKPLPTEVQKTQI
ncbi:efflux RND transporter periplasmic adaptor subunit [Gimesia algae]|uniref:Multidrug resistance protein MdtA n=1 Tax=Gimesia algae TaxID=2527971 RepID=A0A517VAJ7_9PLAN|nr:efflux RND transporter periplasmic adaptor subunit [Gimesia algae]QDT90030.1 Multidrug resistance protein MdtA precursor [Gimesia algae]